MTDLLKPVSRRTSLRDVGRNIIVTLYPDQTIGFRLMRKRTEYRLPIQAAYQIAARIEAERVRKDRIAARKAKREGRLP